MRWLFITIFIASYRVPATSIIFMILYIYSLWIGLATAAAWSWAGQTQLAAGSWLSCSCDCQTVYFLNSAGLGSERASWGNFLGVIIVSPPGYSANIRAANEGSPRYHNHGEGLALANIQLSTRHSQQAAVWGSCIESTFLSSTQPLWLEQNICSK